jgi:hypothetical protein
MKASPSRTSGGDPATPKSAQAQPLKFSGRSTIIFALSARDDACVPNTHPVPSQAETPAINPIQYEILAIGSLRAIPAAAVDPEEF